MPEPGAQSGAVLWADVSTQMFLLCSERESTACTASTPLASAELFPLGSHWRHDNP
jgi:hypothetical protein